MSDSGSVNESRKNSSGSADDHTEDYPQQNKETTYPSVLSGPISDLGNSSQHMLHGLSNGMKSEVEKLPAYANPSNNDNAGDVDNDADDLFPLGLMSTSVPPMTLIWKELGYSVEVKTRLLFGETSTLTLLKGITGALRPGEFMCLMGTSGAGKTTFLNVIANRHLDGGTIAGDIYVNGHKRDASFRRFSAYVEQDDLLMAHLSVRETFNFIAKLRLPNRYTAKEREHKALEVITKLGILGCIETKIGNAFTRGISGGERKRVSIGCELLLNPRILFLDEPTSGLDSFTSYHVMETVKNIAKSSGMSVMTTIHQPRTDLFHLFDKLQLLSKGETVFYGPLAEALRVFEEAGHKCPAMFNPADYVLDITTVDTRTPELKEESTARIANIIKIYNNSPIHQEEISSITDELDQANSSRPHDHQVSIVANKKKKSSRITPVEQWAILSQRDLINFTRDKSASVAGFAQAIIMGLLVALAFLNIGIDGAKAVQNRVGCCFFMVVNMSMGSMFGAVLLFHREKPLFIRERNSGTYNVLPYYIAKTFSEFPIQLLNPIVYVSIAYFAVGFISEAGRFFTLMLILACVLFTAQGFGLLISAVTPNVQVAQGVAPVFVVLFMLYSGFYFNADNVVKPLIWIYYMSYVTYAFSAVMINQFKGLKLNCPDGAGCFANGDQVLEYYVIKGSIWSNMAILIGIGIVLRILAYFALYFTTKPRRAKEN